MSYHEISAEATRVRSKLEKLSLQYLIKINPTLAEMRAINYVLYIGYGNSPRHQNYINIVKNLLEKNVAIV